MSWIAAIIELLAKIVVGQKSKWGHVAHIVGEGVWIAVALQTKIYGLLMIAVPTIILSIRNFIKWSCEEKHTDRSSMG